MRNERAVIHDILRILNRLTGESDRLLLSEDSRDSGVTRLYLYVPNVRIANLSQGMAAGNKGMTNG